jgi:HK97 family phage major capsid protein
LVIKRKKRRMASYKPTSGMREEARKGLDWRKEHGRGGTAVGIARARDIVNGKNLSESTVKRMFSFFSRHEVDKKAEGFRPAEDGYPSNGRIAWALWGGDAGFSWSRKIVNSLKDDRSEERALTGAMRKALENKVKEHNEKHGDDARKKTNLRTLTAVFNRGVGAYKTNPESVRPNVNSPEQWALARVNSFLYALRNLRFRSGKHDLDLLPAAHPLSSKENDDRIANMDTEERHIKDIRETEDSVIVEFTKSEDESEVEENSYHDDEEKGDYNEEVRTEDLSENIETKDDESEEQRNNEETSSEESIENDPMRFYTETHVQRAFEFDRNKIDENKRTVRIGVSTEVPVQRSFGYEVLGHSSDEIDMEFMSSGRSPLLLDHDATKQIGVVEEFSIDSENKRTVAKVRFSKNPMAEEVFRDVVDGIRQNISVGYQVNKMEKEGERDGIPIFRVRGWTPLEVSAVSIPADQSSLVGFGRSKDVNLDNNKKVTIMSNENEKVVPEVNAEDVRAEMAKENAAIIDLAIKHNKRDLGNEAVSKGISLAQFRGQLLETIANDKPLDLPSSVDMNEKEQRSYSLLKAVQESANGNLSGLEKEVSDQIASQVGKSARGFYMPTNLNFGKRDQVVGTNSSGGFLKGTDHLGNEFIEALYGKLVIGQAGARIMQGLKGDVAIPKLSASVTNSAFVAENNAPSEGAATFSQVTMSPKTLAAYLDVSRKLMMQSDPSVEAVLRDDVINTFARKIDEVAIEGGNSNEPSGIIASVSNNVEAIGTNGGAIAYSNVVDMVKLVEEDNAILNDGSVCWLGHPAVTAKLRQTPKQSSGVEGNFILGSDNAILGYKYLDSSLVPNDLTKGTLDPAAALIFGDFSQLMLGFYSGVDVIVDPYTGSSAGTTRLAFFQDLDIALRHDDSFAVCKDIDFS